MREVLQFRFKKTGSFGFEHFVGDVTIGAGFRFLWMASSGPGP